MIANLHIKNIGIIDDLDINLNEGLNILTGETGAGKTLIIDSLKIISGERFSKDMIRKGEDYSYVEICMYLPNNENAIDGNVIVSREIYENGRNLCKINGRLVTVVELKNFMQKFIEIHGQNDNQTLLDSKTHIVYLDNFIGDDILLLKEQYKEEYANHYEMIKILKENYGDEKEKERRLDLLKYELNEIEQANLKSQEEENLEEKKSKIANSEKISSNLTEANIAISDNSTEVISTAIKALSKIENLDNKYLDINNNLKNIYYELQEISRDISNYNEGIYFDENELNDIENRLELISSLKRKYGNTIEEILKYKKQIEVEIEKLENSEEYIKKINFKLELSNKKLYELAKKINKLRCAYSKILSNKINLELEDLEMKNAKINIHVDFCEKELFTNGKDKVKILIQTNIGEDEKELTKIASGGEMSRVMLTIKKVLVDTDEIPVIIFDEIDTGISGKAAKKVGEKLMSISKKHQVICISHLANIAASADYNYLIKKEVINNRTTTIVNLLNKDAAIAEIARIACGEINDITLKYAQELKKQMKVA